MQSMRIEGMNDADVRAQLAARSLRVLEIVPRHAALSARPRTRSDPAFSVLLFSQEFLALIEAGLSVVEALDTLAAHASTAGYRAVVASLRQSVARGDSLSHAMDACQGLFPPVYVGLVRAAESTSNLPRALSRYIDYQSRMDALRNRMVTSSIYPGILLCAGAAVSAFLMIHVVPRFASVYQGSGRPLPWMSALLLQWGRLVAEHSGLVLGALALVAAAVLIGAMRLRQAGGITALLARLPGLRSRVRVYSLSRLYMTLGMLLEGGIATVPALTLARATLFGAQRDALDAATRQVQAGDPLSVAFLAQGLSAPIADRFLKVGERSGNLGEMLIRSASYYDADIARWVERFTRIFEPLLMAAIGLVVGLIVILLYMPIFDLAGSLQ